MGFHCGIWRAVAKSPNLAPPVGEGEASCRGSAPLKGKHRLRAREAMRLWARVCLMGRTRGECLITGTCEDARMGICMEDLLAWRDYTVALGSFQKDILRFDVKVYTTTLVHGLDLDGQAGATILSFPAAPAHRWSTRYRPLRRAKVPSSSRRGKSSVSRAPRASSGEISRSYRWVYRKGVPERAD